MVNEFSERQELALRASLVFPQPLRFLAVWQMLEYTAKQMQARLEIEVAQKLSSSYLPEEDADTQRQAELCDIHGEFYMSASGGISFLVRRSSGASRGWSSLEFDTVPYSTIEEMPQHRLHGVEAALVYCRTYLTEHCLPDSEAPAASGAASNAAH